MSGQGAEERASSEKVQEKERGPRMPGGQTDKGKRITLMIPTYDSKIMG